jgi:hypothetical protein
LNWIKKRENHLCWAYYLTFGPSPPSQPARPNQRFRCALGLSHWRVGPTDAWGLLDRPPLRAPAPCAPALYRWMETVGWAPYRRHTCSWPWLVGPTHHCHVPPLISLPCGPLFLFSTGAYLESGPLISERAAVDAYRFDYDGHWIRTTGSYFDGPKHSLPPSPRKFAIVPLSLFKNNLQSCLVESWVLGTFAS